MKNKYLAENRNIFVSCCTVLFLILTNCVTVSFGQKSDYVILNDSIYREGKILSLPNANNQMITFRLTSKVPPQNLGIDSLNEFSFKNRKFFRKQVEFIFENQPVFLELLAEDAESNKLWKLNGETPIYLIESSNAIILLDEQYQKSLEKILSNAEVSQLINITPMKEYPLKYLFETAKTIQKPRTFTKSLRVLPHIGFNLINLKVGVPGLNNHLQVSSTSASFGINSELFINFNRNISVNLNPSIVFVQASDFAVFENGQESIETDITISLDQLQVPLTIKYYLEISPNRSRAFLESGYVFGKSIKNNANSFQGRIVGNEVFTSREVFQLPDIHQGIVFGAGIEKYLNNHNAINLGSKALFLNGATSTMTQFQFFIGYKF